MRSCVAIWMLAGCGRIGFDASQASSDGDGRAGDGSFVIGDGKRPAANLVFATSRTYLPTELGSLSGADTICSNHAGAIGLTGTFVAWLSTSTVDARDRIASARGFVRLDGLIIADLAADIASGYLERPIAYDELGHRLFGEPIITGTTFNGMFSTRNCGNFTSPTGLITSGYAEATSGFAEWDSQDCATKRRIYCFEIDRSVPVTEPPASGRIAFASGVTGPGGGVAFLDTRCMMEAASAGLPGMFSAMIATTSGSPASRFSASGANWVRRDGVPIAVSPAEFLAGNWIAPIDVPADGQGIATGGVWTGANTMDSVGTAAMTCSDWSISSAAATGYAGMVSATGSRSLLTPPPSACNRVEAIYCVQH